MQPNNTVGDDDYGYGAHDHDYNMEMMLMVDDECRFWWNGGIDGGNDNSLMTMMMMTISFSNVLQGSHLYFAVSLCQTPTPVFI